MNTKFQWYDFARPKAELEREADEFLKELQSGGSSSKKPTAAPAPLKPNTKSSSSSGEKSRCQKGKSCGITCIYAGDECISELDPSVSSAMGQLVSHVQGYIKRGGQEEVALAALGRLESDSISSTAKKISQSLDKINKEYKDPEERERRISQVFDLVLPGIAKKGDTGEKQAYSQNEIEHLRDNKSIDKYERVYQDVLSGKLKTPAEVNDALRPLAAQRRVNDISDAQLDLAMSLLPKDLILGLSKQGQPGVWGKWGSNQSTLDVPDGGHTPKNQSPAERARLIVRIGMEEGMRDMYTGRKIGFGDIDLEHTIPFGVGKAGAETGSNFGLTTRLSNRAKGDISPEEWRQKVLSKYPSEGGTLTEAAMKRLQKEQAAADKYNSDKAKVSGGTRPDTVASIFKGIDESNDKEAVKSKLKNKALQSLAGYTETYMQGFRANRAGASRRVYFYRGNETGSKIMDLAAQKIDQAYKSNDLAKVEKILEILRSGSLRVNKALDEKYGPQRLDNQATEAASVANSVRNSILSEIAAL